MTKPVSSTPVDCPVCKTTISRKADLGRHMDLHDPNKENKKHACPYPGCTYRALQRNNLKIHLNTHTGERPHKCTEIGCDFSTGDPGSLTRHRTRIHGRNPEKNRQATTIRKATRQQRRTAPYPSLEISATPAPQTSRILDETPFLPPPAGHRVVGRDVKNALAAYSTELIPKLLQVNDSIISPDTRAEEPLLPQSGLTTEVPVDAYSQLSALEPIRQWGLSTLDLQLLAEPLPDVTLDGTNSLFDGFLSQFDHMQGIGASTLPPVPLPAPLLPTYEAQPYNMNGAYLPTPVTLPTYENSYMVECAPYEHYGYPTEATSSFDAPFSYSLPFAASDTIAYPQAPSERTVITPPRWG